MRALTYVNNVTYSFFNTFDIPSTQFEIQDIENILEIVKQIYLRTENFIK